MSRHTTMFQELLHPRTLFVGLVTTLGLAAAASAQTPEVVLSEVMAGGADRWIELHNRTTAPVDISAWSIYQATQTPGRTDSYWWGFPPGTVIDGGGYLRVRWLQPFQSPQGQELWTGDTVWHFLFGLGAEPLDAPSGALALLRTRLNTQMNTPAMFADWVSWGSANFLREDLAAQNGRWLLGHSAPAPRPGESLARDLARIGQLGAPEHEWFLDSTPSPLAANVPGAQTRNFGQPCTPPGSHLLGGPQLRAASIPALGNRDFALHLNNTTGLLFESALFLFACGEAPGGLPSPLPATAGTPCAVLVDWQRPIGVMFVHTSLLTTSLPLSLANLPQQLAGANLFVQALVLDPATAGYPPFQGTSDGLQVTIGG